MYLWKTEQLSSALKNDDVSNDDFRKYLMLWMVLVSCMPYVTNFAPQQINASLFAEIVATDTLK